MPLNSPLNLEKSAISKCHCASLVVVSVLFYMYFLPAISYGKSADDMDSVRLVFERSGLSSQLGVVGNIVRAEVTDNRMDCTGHGGFELALDTFLSKLYLPATLNEIGLNALAAKISSSEIEFVHSWYDSALGIRIVEAESSASSLNESTVDARYADIANSAQWEGSRKRLIQRLVVATKAHEFVTALNTALTGAVSVASLCNDQVTNIDEVLEAVEKSVNEEELVAFFMLSELIAPTAVIFERFSDGELRSYIAFASTDVGMKIHGILVDTVRSSVLQQLPALRHFMEHTAG